MKNLVDKLSQEIEKLEGVTAKVTAKKITYAHKLPFAAINIKPGKIELQFTTPSKIKHTRLTKIKQLKPNKFSHKISITSEEEIDPQVTGWLMIAHATN